MKNKTEIFTLKKKEKKNHYTPRGNHCASQLKKKILNLDDVDIFSIRLSNKKIKTFKNPSYSFPENKVDKKPEIITRQSICKIMKKNNLVVYVLKNNIFVKDYLIGVEGVPLGKKIVGFPKKHFVQIDLSNKILKLVGEKAKQGWVQY